MMEIASPCLVLPSRMIERSVVTATCPGIANSSLIRSISCFKTIETYCPRCVLPCDRFLLGVRKFFREFHRVHIIYFIAISQIMQTNTIIIGNGLGQCLVASYSGAVLWNSLPQNLRQAKSLSNFKTLSNKHYRKK